MDNEYSVIFTGDIGEGLDLDLVKSNISAKLKLSEEQVNKIFSSAPKSIKKYNNNEEAEKLVAAFKSCGATCVIEGPEDDLSDIDVPDEVVEEVDAIATEESAEEDAPLWAQGIAVLLIVVVVLFVFSRCSTDENSDEYIIDKAWDAYVNWKGNEGDRYVDVKGRIIKKGSVPPSAMNSVVKGRLPASLTCYEFVRIDDIGDLAGEMCLYYTRNPERGDHALMWRGPKFISQLKSVMYSDDFIEDK